MLNQYTVAAKIFAGITPYASQILLAIKAIAWLTGLILLLNSISRARHTTRKSADPKEPARAAWQAIFAICLINMASVMETIGQTLFDHTAMQVTSLGYQVGEQISSNHAQFIFFSVITFIQLIGYVSVFRGFTELNKLQKGGTNATLGKGLTHIFGGVIAANLPLFANSIGAVVGLKMRFDLLG